MTKLRTLYRCRDCGGSQPRWSGRCGACGEWNTVEEEPAALTAAAPGPGARAPLPLAEVDMHAHPPMSSGIDELDRVLGGGLLPGSATLLGGEPGTGKSTLLLQVMAAMASAGRRCLLVAAEEAAHQVRRRAARLGADIPGVFVVEATQLSAVEEAVVSLRPDIVVVDSIQALGDAEIASPAGSLAQVRSCAQALVTLAKASGTALVLVGHVTKEGVLAGPRALEHLVDTVLSFEGDRYLSLRALRAVKHRFGPTGETGLFEMEEEGLTAVADPSTLFLGDRLEGAPGSAVAACLEGHRPVLVEVQALVGRPSQLPRRSVSGLDPSRVPFLLAVLDRRAGVPIGDRDVYVSVTGGVRFYEPAADLAACLALASSALGAPLPADMVAVGEVGLGGEVRRVSRVDQRLAEAARVGFRSALLPASLAGTRRSAANGAAAEARRGDAGEGRLRTTYAATLREALAVALRSEQQATHCVGRRARALADGLTSTDAGRPECGDDGGPDAHRPRPTAARWA